MPPLNSGSPHRARAAGIRGVVGMRSQPRALLIRRARRNAHRDTPARQSFELQPARRLCLGERASARDAAQGAAEGNDGHAIEDELDPDGEANEPQTHCGQQHEQRDAERHGDKA
jgi:hypothetical protein